MVRRNVDRQPQILPRQTIPPRKGQTSVCQQVDRLYRVSKYNRARREGDFPGERLFSPLSLFFRTDDERLRFHLIFLARAARHGTHASGKAAGHQHAEVGVHQIVTAAVFERFRFARGRVFRVGPQSRIGL